MNTHRDPRDLTIDLLSRSECQVAVAAVLADGWGITSWGWNSSGRDGLGQHAEDHCLRRANPKRVMGSYLYVAARRKRNQKTITARPCEDCQRFLNGMRVKTVYYRDGGGEWQLMTL